jgi:alkylation response protein AidB-like acyl-CoA dehydrogenase
MTIGAERIPGATLSDPIELARALAEEFRPAVVERERLGEPPIEELARIRETELVSLHIPVEFGGGGGSWQQIARVILELSRVDPNIGGLLAYHYHNFLAPFMDPLGDAAEIQRKSAANRWLWGHITGPVGDFQATPQPDGSFRVSGRKQQNTGPATGDVTVLLAERTDRKEALYAYVPTDRKGIAYHGGWDHLGLRRTATQPISFDDVVVHPDEVLPNTTGRPIQSLAPFYHATGGLGFGAIYVGAAWGALETAREYLLTEQHPRPGQETAAEDPYVQALFGELVVKANALVALQDETAERLDQARANRRSLTSDEHDEIGMYGEAFRSLAARTGIEIGNRVFDALGAGAAARRVGLDRYWRDVRIHSLHPPTYPQSDVLVGDYVVNGEAVRLRLPL